jgi:hypothetical protein
MPIVFGRAGLAEVGMSVTIDMVGGGGPTNDFWKTTFAQLQPFLLDQQLVTEETYNQAHAQVDDPTFRDTLWAYIRTWGRRPAG